MTVWFTSDEHMGHANIIRYCRRPFADARDMTERLVERHNAVIPRKIHYDVGGKQACSTAFVSPKRLTKTASAVTCKLCLAALNGRA